MPDDIRDAPVGEYWDRFEQRWTGLLSYRYLGKSHATLDRGGGETMRLRHDMRNASGGIMAAPLCIASPESGGMADDGYVPNPVARWGSAGRRSSMPRIPSGWSPCPRGWG